MMKTSENQLGQRWQKIRLPVDLEPHYMLIVIHLHVLNYTPTVARTVLRLTIKGQKVGSGPILGNPCPFPNIIGIFLPLVSL